MDSPGYQPPEFEQAYQEAYDQAVQAGSSPHEAKDIAIKAANKASRDASGSRSMQDDQETGPLDPARQ